MSGSEVAHEEVAAAEPERRGAATEAPLPALSLSVPGVLMLQRRAGNAAAVQTLRDAGVVPVAVAERRLRDAREARGARERDPGTRHRVPSASELKSLYSGGLLDKADVEAAMRRALERMDADIELRTGADDVMKKLFPGGGVFDESAWSGVLGSDTLDVYTSAADAEAKLKPDDLKKVTEVAEAAATEIDKAIADDAGLKDVFGTKADLAKKRYGLAKAALKRAIQHADKAIDTDYNGDDSQTGLGGWANFSSQHIHLEGGVAQVKDRTEAIITLIHESCHLSDPAVDDLGYYGSRGFEAMEDAEKVNNAAHYEELPARSLGVSLFRNRDPADKTKFLPGFQPFVPKKTAGGGAVTFEDEVRRQASEYLRKAWDAAVDAHAFIRDTARRIGIGPVTGATFNARKTKLLEMSKVMHLTIHLQKPKPSTVTLLDVALSEGVAHGTTRIQGKLRKQSVPASGDKAAAVRAAVEGAIADYGQLTGNAGDDLKLMDWLVAHYRNI